MDRTNPNTYNATATEMGNKLNREEIVYMNHEKTVKIARLDGTELYMHKEEVIAGGELKRGHYVAQHCDTHTGKSIYNRTHTTGDDKIIHKQKLFTPSVSQEFPRRPPNPWKKRAKSAGPDSGKSLPDLDDLPPIHRPSSPCSHRDSGKASTWSGEDETESENTWGLGGSKANAGPHSSDSVEPGHSRESEPRSGQRRSDAGSCQSDFTTANSPSLKKKLLAIFSREKGKSGVTADKEEQRNKDGHSHKGDSPEAKSVASTVREEAFKASLAQLV